MSLPASVEVMKIGEYEVIEKIDTGGMATVYKGLQASLNRPVAIKVLSEKLSEDSKVVERFNRESLIIARLTHPNIIHVIDRGITSQGRPYFVMDFIEGADLATKIKERAYNTNQKLDIIIQVCKALSYAHKNGVIHRDIKPANILIDSEGNVLVSDFGIAQFFDKDTDESEFTREGAVMGTPTYMSPEQKVSSKKVTESSDLYSLGVLMYELFTGNKPLGYFKPPSQINPHVSNRLENVILQCLEPEPSDRFTSADEIKDVLLEMLQGAHIQDAQKKEAIQGISKMEDIFALLDVIKEHRFGAVYLFRHKTTGQLMVVKKYNGTLGGFKEAKRLSTLKHKNIADIYGVSGDERLFIVVMEYMSGGSLKDRLVRPHPWIEVLRTAKDICEGLSFAHENKIIHGNLRPSNILITTSGTVKITDFGLNEHYHSDIQENNWYNRDGKPRSYQSDIFAAGVIFYEMLVGSVPVWERDGFLENEQFLSLPLDLQRVIFRMLTRDETNRYDNFDEVLVSIDDMLLANDGEPTQLVSEEKDIPQKTRKKNSILPMQTFLLFVLLLVTASAYVYFTGRTEFYMKWIQKLWMSVMEIIPWI
ncbi:MAG: serine/threonine-protein kinase [Thermodesulfobacteriota bacterium]|nr:serine/threonine-protein kinase [Thermodesulfobacteriota bacterium]